MQVGGISALRRKYALADTKKQPGGPPYSWAVVLDDNVLNTPAGVPLLLPTEQLANAIAAEWAAQGEQVAPDTMPLCQLAMTALDRIGPQRQAMHDELLKYLDTELICHYGTDEKLVAYQRQHWQPLHSWITEKYQTTLPVTFAVQPVRAVLPKAVFTQQLERFDIWRLTALSQAVAVSGSFVIGLALVQDVIDADVALLAAEAEADWQAQKWGMDAEAHARRDGIAAELQAIQRFIGRL